MRDHSSGAPLALFCYGRANVGLDQMPVYDPLRDHLRLCNLPLLRMSFAEIEGVIGRPLPLSAREYQWWWANEDPMITRHSQSRAWKAAGYDAEVSLTEQMVVFQRQHPD